MNNNPRFDPDKSKSPEALRSDIDTTRQRMDDTIDALTSRFKGRHLVDELLGLFRSSDGNGGGAARVKEKVTEGASTAVHAVVDAVKAHPLPTLMIGAGVAWMLYEKRQGDPGYSRYEYEYEYDPDYDARREAGARGWEEDVSYEYPASNLASDESGFSAGAGFEGESGGAGSGMKQKFRDLKGRTGSRAAAAGGSLRERGEHLRQRGGEWKQRGREQAGELGHRMQAGYAATRERLSSTVDHHPLETALGAMAVGIIAGLLIPAPRRLSEVARPTAERLRERAREAGHDLMERGRHVAQAATQAAREEIDSQGLTPDALKSKAQSVAERARDAAEETADEEGIHPKTAMKEREKPGSGSPSGTAGGSPSGGTQAGF